MKSKVHFSYFCVIITVVVLAAFIACIITSWDDPKKCLLASVITLIAIITGLYYCPVSVTADSDKVSISRLLSGDKTFSYADIESVDTCYPSAGGLRLCGSGGFFGYWGYFSDIIIGQYFGYYADRSQCFYLKLKNKRQYVISCRDHTAIVRAIQSHL